MKCYDFELNISAYIEGDLKQVIRHKFKEHKEVCHQCEEKLEDISQLMKQMPKMINLTTSDQFRHNLNQKIQEIDNRGPSIWERMILFRPLGFEPVSALGFAIAMVMIVSASYFLLDRDSLPEINMEKLSSRSQNQTPQQFKPSVVNPKQTVPSMADSDSSVKQDNQNLFNDRIKLVGGN